MNIPKKHLNCNTVSKNFKCNCKTIRKKLKIIKLKGVTVHNKPSCNSKITMNLKRKNLSKRIWRKKKSTKKKSNKLLTSIKKKSRRKLTIYRKSMSFSRNNSWLIKWSPRKQYPCSNTSSILRPKLMTVLKLNTPNRKSFTKKKKSNLFRKINSFLILYLKKEKIYKRKLMTLLRKNPKSKSNSLPLPIKKKRLSISQKLKTIKSSHYKLNLLKWWKNSKKQDNRWGQSNQNFKINLWKKLSTTKRKLP